MDKTIKTLRIFFRTTNFAYDLTEMLADLSDKVVYHDKIKSLHRMALREIEKDEPNMDYINLLLKQMEELAETNKSNNI